MREKIYHYFVYASAVVCALGMVGCGLEDKENPIKIKGGNEIAVMPTTSAAFEESLGISNENTKGIAITIDEEKKRIVVKPEGGEVDLVVTYDGTTCVYDRYEKLTTIDSVLPGSVVEVSYDSDRMKCVSINVSKDEWQISEVTNFTISQDEKKLCYGNKEYSFEDDLVIMSKDVKLSPGDLESVDTITLIGDEKKLKSIIVTQGHGYVSLKDTAFFEGGYVEIGSKIIQVITKDMKLAVPEGEYMFQVTKNGKVGSKDISVKANEEISISLTEFQDEAVRNGTVKYTVTPAGATLKIDEKEYDINKSNDIPYGMHKIEISMDGYEPYTDTITVEDVYKEFKISLVPSGPQEPSGDTMVVKETTTVGSEPGGETQGSVQNQTNNGSTVNNATNGAGEEKTQAAPTEKRTTYGVPEAVGSETRTTTLLESILNEETTTNSWYSYIADIFD